MREDIPLAAPGLAVAARPARSHAWEGGLRRWDAYYAAILVATLLILVVARPPHGAQAGAALAAMVPWYVLVGRGAITAERGQHWRAAVYLTGLFGLLMAAELAGYSNTFILLALCPQCFMMASFRWAVAAVTALDSTTVVAALVWGQHGAGLAVTAAEAALVLAFSVTFGSWIFKIINQSAERAELIDQLEATRAELAAAHREAGVLAERQRLSADIHDTIAQGFASIVMLMQAAEASLDAGQPDGTRRHLVLASETARENLAEARALVAGLTPAQLDGGTLDDALRRVAAQVAGPGALTADLEITGTARPLSTSAEVMLLRVGQEALANVRKHAGASRAGIRLEYAEAEVRLVISDDGAGFDPAAACAGYGLRGMRARVAEAGGSLLVRSAPREGTTVSVTVPA
ncbi:MAG TPA: sensor histidine kinase [Streptosporangiaceae bacterium]|nr:sensor histidine kinase [Streptosporangiaceae bacterium]